MSIFVTGGAGFIGSQFIRDWVVQNPDELVINFDSLTYAGNLENLAPVDKQPNYRMVKGDICDENALLAAIPEACAALVNRASNIAHNSPLTTLPCAAAGAPTTRSFHHGRLFRPPL